MATKCHLEPGQKSKIALYAATFILLVYDVIAMMREIVDADSPFLELTVGLQEKLDPMGNSHDIPRD